MAARRPTRRSRRPFQVPPAFPASPPFRPHTRSTEATPLMVNRCRYGGRSTLSLRSFHLPFPSIHKIDRHRRRPTYYDTTILRSLRSLRPFPHSSSHLAAVSQSELPPCPVRVGRSRRCSIAQETRTSGHSLKKGASSDAVRAFSFRLRRCFHGSFHFIYI